MLNLKYFTHTNADYLNVDYNISRCALLSTSQSFIFELQSITIDPPLRLQSIMLDARYAVVSTFEY